MFNQLTSSIHGGAGRWALIAVVAMGGAAGSGQACGTFSTSFSAYSDATNVYASEVSQDSGNNPVWAYAKVTSPSSRINQVTSPTQNGYSAASAYLAINGEQGTYTTIGNGHDDYYDSDVAD